MLLAMGSRYDWHRYWCSREGNYSLTSDGFLQEPYKKYPHLGGIRTFEAIAETPALLLLGEPGIGKTAAINAERASIAASVAARSERILWPDLQAVSTTDTFDRLVVSTPEFQAWLSGGAILHLYLDALDECMLRVRTLGRLLTNALRNGPADRLWLRLTCRTAEWSHELETDLKQLLGEDRVKAFELLPLTRSDVRVAVAANGIDEDSFFSYVERTDAGALASRPVPLDFLIRCFRRGDLPATQVELYERGCLTLCEEFEHRMETGLPPILTATQRLAVAKRIAASTIFSTRSTLLLGRDDVDVPPEALRLTELTGGKEQTGGLEIDVTENALRDALDTGLFTSRGARVLGWAHHTYEEYLAARYVSDSSLSPPQILTLIVHPDDSGRRLTPQLHQVAAWLAILHPEIFEDIVEHEPVLLLLSDVVVERDEHRALLVDAILQRKRKRQLARIDPMAYAKLRKLDHPRLADQLRPILTNPSEPPELREFAADIAKYTRCASLVPELTQIALDAGEPLDVRGDAATAVEQIGDDVQRSALKPLMNGSLASRLERRLVRLGLQAAWPHALTAEELFDFLRPNRRRARSMADDFILAGHIRETLTDDHLPPALNWVLRRVRSLPEMPTIRPDDAFESLEDAIIVRAWQSNDDAMTAVLASIAIEKIRRWEPLVSRDDEEDISDQRLMEDTPRRRRFATFLITALASDPRPRLWLLFDKTPYLQSSDLPWLLGRQSTTRSPAELSLEAELILYFADFGFASTLEMLTSAALYNPKLKERLAQICAAIPLNSEQAATARQDYRESQQFQREREERRARRPKPARRDRRIPEALDKAESSPCLFWAVLEELARKDDDIYTNSMNLDVETFPGWLVADDETRRRTIAAAERFVRECDPDADSWFATQQFARSAVGGVRSLKLLKSAAPVKFATLEPHLWQRWTPALLGIPNNDPTVPLLADAYRHAPDEVIRRVQQLASRKEAYIVGRLSDIVDDRLVSALLHVVREMPISDEALVEILQPLLPYAATRQLAESIVETEVRSGSRKRAVAVAAMLLLHAPNESWRAVWPLIIGDVAFGHAVIECAVSREHFGEPLFALEEERVETLYSWLTREYPPELDAEHEGVFTPDTRDKIATWRSNCLNALKQRGTQAAVDALRHLAADFPEQIYLSPLVEEADFARRQKSWQPTPVATLRHLLSDRSRRQVRSETELADVVIESLGRLEDSLQGPTPAAFDLWNTSPYRPKTENECSNYIARWLRDDLKRRGVIIAREVEIRAPSSPGSGERTDIHIDVAVDLGQRVETFSVIVEVKGCWNPDLHTAMTNQLAERYLCDNSTRTGVFITCWFAAVAWDATDHRQRKCTSDRALVLSSLGNEAHSLNSRGFDIRPFVLNCSLR